VLLVATALVVVLGGTACTGPRFVDRIVIDNTTEFTSTVDVGGGASGDWVSLTTAEAHSEKTVEGVLDRGATWVFRFGYSDYQQEVQISRDALVDAGWRVQVPDSFGTALRDRGVTPPP
jgi:hypothetical protein